MLKRFISSKKGIIMLPINIYTNLAIQKAQCETRHKRLKRAQLAHLARQKHCLNIRPDVPYKIQRAKNQITESHKLNCLSEFYANELLTEVIGIKNPIATSISIYAKALIQLQKNDTSELDPAAKRALIISKNFLEQNVFSTLL
ncbi:MAG: hypothetical protein K0R98_1066, partial [Rickettsiaceae bacterium]|nr:hypothetical protein [Rickettsiaceae bacterium]